MRAPQIINDIAIDILVLQQERAKVWLAVLHHFLDGANDGRVANNNSFVEFREEGLAGDGSVRAHGYFSGLVSFWDLGLDGVARGRGRMGEDGGAEGGGGDEQFEHFVLILQFCFRITSSQTRYISVSFCHTQALCWARARA
jgi:hypothetical protein